MAKVTVKLFGVLRVDSGIPAQTLDIDTISKAFDEINAVIAEKAASNGVQPLKLSFSDAIVFVNGERNRKKNLRLSDGDEIWLMSPASGG